MQVLAQEGVIMSTLELVQLGIEKLFQVIELSIILYKVFYSSYLWMIGE